MADKPDKKPAQPAQPAIKLHKQMAMGLKPDNGGSYAKGPKTPA